MKSNETIKIVIADDHEFFRIGFIKFITYSFPQTKFIAEARNGIELVELVKKHRPQVAITDIQMPKMDGIQACRIIKDNYPGTNVIAFSVFDKPEQILGMLDAGAIGYLVKSSEKEEILQAIENVSKGTRYYCSSIAEKCFRDTNRSHQKDKQKIQFTFQEIKVIKLICEQLSNKEIASQLKLSTRTVEDYRRNIQEKIGAKNVVGTVLYAVFNNLVKEDEAY
jgi:DNA-binding NarL/FixJ family response regulator